MSAILCEGYRTGCIGRIAQLHADHYAASNGFGVEFEVRVARELADFFTAYQPRRDGLWLAIDDDNIEGSIAIDSTRATDEGAHLRWFITSNALRGEGMGRQLISKAVAFVDTARYRRTYLWTFDGLLAARHLYESYGFHLVHESTGTRWGTSVLEQKFVRQN